MKKTNNFFQAFYFILILMTGHSLLGTADPIQSKPQSMWKLGDQFIELVASDSQLDSPPQANQHPVTITAQQLLGALSRIQVTSEKTLFAKERNQPLLQPHVADLIAQELSKGFEIATPQQDIVFAVNTLITGAGIGKEKVSVAGRVFYLNHRLHIIIGDLFASTTPEAFYNQKTRPTKIDRRLHPHQVGKRAKVTQHTKHQISEDGLTFNNNRRDWLILDLDDKQVSSSSKPTSDNKQSRETVSNHTESTNKNIEERLLELKRLFDKGIITKEEYATTRARILREI